MILPDQIKFSGKEAVEIMGLSKHRGRAVIDVAKTCGQTSCFILTINNWFDWFDSLCPIQQFFSDVGTGLPGSNG